MRNFVTYDAQERILPSLFIGVVRWPYFWDDVWNHDEERLVYFPLPPEVERHGKGPFSVSVDLPPEIIVTEHQTAGYACHHLHLFGVFVKLGLDDPLVLLADSYYHSQISAPALWEELKEWEAKIAPLGLDLRGYAHAYFQEAFASFSAESAFAYAKKNAVGVHTADGGCIPWPEQWKDFDDLARLMEAAWEEATKWRPWGRVELAPFMPPLVGAIVYENSD